MVGITFAILHVTKIAAVVVTFMVGITLWFVLVTFMVSISFMVVITFIGDTTATRLGSFTMIIGNPVVPSNLSAMLSANVNCKF